MNCDNMLMVLGVSTQLTDEQQDITTPLLMKGFTDHAKSAGTQVRGGQSVRNPYPMIGGIGTAIVTEEQMIRYVVVIDA